MPAAVTFAEGVSDATGLGDEVGMFLAALVHALLLFHLCGLLPIVLIWLERKVSARIQDRLGPTRVGGRFGWLQSVADGIKLIQKEDLVPRDADRLLFRLSPIMAVVASFAAFMVLPFSPSFQALASDVGIFLLLALLSIEVFGVILGGYASGSKWALFGAIREAAQMVSYEIPLAICTLVPLVVAGTLNLTDIGRLQAGFFTNWLVFNDPFCLIAFFIFFTVATASVKRAPFDLAEAESELVAGFHTEYSGLRWSFFFFAEYCSMFVVSTVAAVLFLGAWNSGLGLEAWLPAPDQHSDGTGRFAGFSLGGYVANLFAMFVTMTKASLLVVVQMWLRWTLPRLRIDQVMTTCLKYLLPISCTLFLGASVWPLVLASTLGRTTLLPRPLAGPRSVALAAREHAAASPAVVVAARPGPLVPGSALIEQDARASLDEGARP